MPYERLCSVLRCLYQQVMEEVVKLLAPINTTKLETHGEGTDISPWMQSGVPGQLNQCERKCLTCFFT